MTPELIATVVASVLAGISAVWIYFSKVVIPAKLEESQRILEAKLEGDRDEREHRQRQSELEEMYHQSEISVSHQLVTETLANSQEALSKVHEFLRSDVQGLLKIVEDHTSVLPKLSVDLGKTKYELRQVQASMRIIIDIIQRIYEKDKE